ncbi:39S ribosomal protein L50, mitochondrial-like isoform X2 [Mercenaria mercenaria]|nr:39S ribosomal protein L50, mitochondrial-like isoform X2 [Mercenaria mercenaria]
MGFLDKLKFLQKKKDREIEDDIVSLEANEKLQEGQTRQFRKRESIEERPAYQPPADAAKRIHAITHDIFGPEKDWLNIQLDDRVHKFDLVTRVMEELDHEVPSVDLNDIETVEDVVKFFNIEVKDTSVLEDLTKLDLPKNLHMNLEYIRFHPDTDKIYDGITAFPGRPTIVTSIKYKRKYKGYDGGDPVNYPEKVIGRD